MVFLILAALVSIFSPEWAFVKKSYDFSVQLMLAYLILGLGFLAAGNRKLLLTSFACCGALCLFLKQSSNNHLRLPVQNKDEKITIAHFNTSSATFGYESLVQIVKQSDADIISFQEVTPDWDFYLKSHLEDLYPYNESNVRIDPYGMAIFSKIPINKYDTFTYDHIPHQVVNIPISPEQNINIICANILPPVGKRLNEHAKFQLLEIANKITEIKEPSIVVGDFNLVYWSNEIRSFTEKAKLENSRRDISQNFLKVPYDHIFFSSKLECTGFRDLSDSISSHLGIIGSYQLKNLPQIRESKLTSFWNK